jgi:hypothetical protein
MPGPGTPKEALAWAQVAMRESRYIPSKHFQERLHERAIDALDVRNAILKATLAVPYENGVPRNDGTCWRVAGPDIDGGRTIAVGVEAFLDHKKRRMVLVTAFEVTDRRAIDAKDN